MSRLFSARAKLARVLPETMTFLPASCIEYSVTSKRISVRYLLCHRDVPSLFLLHSVPPSSTWQLHEERVILLWNFGILDSFYKYFIFLFHLFYMPTNLLLPLFSFLPPTSHLPSHLLLLLIQKLADLPWESINNGTSSQGRTKPLPLYQS